MDNGIEIQTPMEFLSRFQRCKNYPRDEEGILALANGLEAASRHTGITMADIVERCATSSDLCPTDYDLLTVAKEIKIQRAAAEEATRDRHAEWKKQYGPPQPYDWQSEAAKIMPAASRSNERQRKMWAALRDRFDSKHWPDWHTLAKAARELGYEDYATAWEKSGG